jgi:hypothetical protein
MDLAARENALLIGMVRERMSNPAGRIGGKVTAVAKGIENLTEAGKILLDLAADETTLAVDGLKEGMRLPTPAEAMAHVVRHLMGFAVIAITRRALLQQFGESPWTTSVARNTPDVLALSQLFWSTTLYSVALST